MDQDPRHSFKDWGNIAEVESPKPAQPIDRRDLPKGSRGSIDIDKVKNFIPTAPKVPDCIQFPIESLFAPIKGSFKKERLELEEPTPKKLENLMRQAFAKYGTAEACAKNWAHAWKCMKVFSGRKGEKVMIEGVEYACTDGNWLPKALRG